MSEPLDRARRSIQDASDTTDEATVREQLHSLDKGLSRLEEAEGLERHEHADRFEEVESKLAGLIDETDEAPVRTLLRDARDYIDAYRQKYAHNW